MVHLMPHWNFEGREGENMRVVAYTNCDALELYLNGKSLGRREIEKYGHGEWQVPYERGELRVEAFRDGKLVAEDKRVTTGRAVALKMRVDNKVEKANGRDVAIVTCYCVDENGLEVPTAAPFVRFHCNTLGKILGTGSDVCDHTPVTEPQRQMRAGRIGVALMVGKSAGELKLYATAEGLSDAVLTIELK
jgi:beta-galactosidase